MEKDIILKAENISKQYRLGQVGTGTLSHDFNKWWHAIRGKENPYLKIGDTNDRSTKGTSDYVWALQDINFEVERGEVLGIIGKNGAGKSTLLKILSKVTAPTTGSIKCRGRIASLLEVGTGFHGEMTGRENVYLNGAILGMTKKEITSKINDIIEFSGCERYIDTPVKRYSSGMTVRLAFAVAAFLEPEILVIDEVLAVGDAEFQKKAIGKMQDISRQGGRTVLFVSHNMAAIENLCTRCVLLERGMIVTTGLTSDVISYYLANQNTVRTKLSEITERNGNGILFFNSGRIIGSNSDQIDNIETFSDVQIQLNYSIDLSKVILNSRIDVGINNYLGDRVAWVSSNNIVHDFDVTKGEIIFKITNLPLAPGEYTCNIFAEINNEISDWLSSVMPFTVIEKDYYGTGKLIPANQGSILLNYEIN
ncbi:ABC transporter ATP-binding protein [Flavobacterium sp. LC2016-12]|uniref:ABC transporter ATP-binding protein n=1 Tax=Flavobacterium sp. LC2016-12 TaxID=2783794 RepID=UPI00188CC1A1|nr:ABC transporter ATP-binding protein [Flavobacterium sp. LC2016-12]MBF4465660.1 ATP-binding cassette domain-containing protein [Flavobacterium sp. LC2016-12]